MRLSRTTLAGAALAVSLATAAPGQGAAGAAAAPTPGGVTFEVATAGAGAEFLALTNATRASLGVAGLRADAALQAHAQAQAQAMAASGRLFHSDLSGLLGGWSAVAENVGVGADPASVHGALVASPGHHANMTNPGFAAVGVGVAFDDGGRLFTAHVFAA